MSAAIVNVGLMRESRFRIRSVTAHAYACDTVVATRRSGERPRKWRKARGFRSPLIADDLDQHALAATAVELAIKNLLPGTEVELPAVIATTTSRPMIWRFIWASALSSPVRLWR